MDSAQVTDSITRKVSITHAVVRSADEQQPSGTLLPSNIMQQAADDRKRTREEIEALKQTQQRRQPPWQR